MSIYDEVQNRIAEGRLHELVSAMSTSPIVRRIVAAPEIMELVNGPWVSEDWEERCGYLRADLDRFLDGSEIAVAKKPYGSKTSYLKQLDPPTDEVWEIRSRDPKPGIRIFGRFAATDFFIALGWAKRPDLEGPASRSFRDAKVRCITSWRNFFPVYDPIHATTAEGHSRYVTKYILV